MAATAAIARHKILVCEDNSVNRKVRFWIVVFFYCGLIFFIDCNSIFILGAFCGKDFNFDLFLL